MRYPFWVCEACNDLPIAEVDFPLTPDTKKPICPNCGNSYSLDVVIGNEETVLDEDLVVWRD